MNAKTTVLKGKTIERNWVLIDLKGQSIGRACTQIAKLLMGKDKPTFSYHRDDGDYVVAINASQIVATGNKTKQKMYYHHTPWAGHLKEFTLGEMLKKDPRKVIEIGVKGMLPKNRLRDVRITRLKVFVGPEHKYADKIGK